MYVYTFSYITPLDRTLLLSLSSLLYCAVLYIVVVAPHTSVQIPKSYHTV